MKERVGHRDGLAHVAHTVHRLYQQLLIGVRVLLEMDAQRAARQLHVGRAVDLYRGHAGLRVGGFDMQVFALNARLEGGTGVVNAVDRQAFAVRLAIGVGHNDFYLAVFQQVDPDVARGQRPVYERLSAHADAHGGPARATQVPDRDLHHGAVEIPAGRSLHFNFIACRRSRGGLLRGLGGRLGGRFLRGLRGRLGGRFLRGLRGRLGGRFLRGFHRRLCSRLLRRSRFSLCLLNRLHHQVRHGVLQIANQSRVLQNHLTLRHSRKGTGRRQKHRQQKKQRHQADECPLFPHSFSPFQSGKVAA